MIVDLICDFYELENRHFSRGGNFDTKNSVRTRAGKPVFPQHFPSSPKTHDCSVYNVFEINPRKCCCFFFKTLRETEGKSPVSLDYKNVYSLF